MKKQSKAIQAAIRTQMEAEALALSVQLPTAEQSLDDVLQAGALAMAEAEAEAAELGTCSQPTEAEAEANAKAEAIGERLASGALETEAAKAAHKGKAESLASVCKALLTLPAPDVRAGLESAFSQVKAQVWKTMAITDASPESVLVKAGEQWRGACQVIYSTCRRINQPKPTDKPLYGLFYVSLKKGDCSSVVRVITCPTEAEVREALSHDAKALNAWMQANAEKPAATLASLTGTDSGESRAAGQPDKHAPGSALQAVFDLVAGWRPIELEACAARLLAMASAQRAAVANAADKPAALAEAAAAEAVASAKHAEAEAEATRLAEAAKQAVAQAEADKAATLRASKLQALREQLAEAEAEAERDAKLAEAMANGQPTDAPSIAQASIIAGQLVVHA